MNTWTCCSGSPDETAQIAQTMGEYLRPGDTVLLAGPIGAGKTHFARSLIQSLLVVPEDVPSPTFTLVQTYQTRLGELWHTDLYRLTSADDVVELGLLEAFDDAICLVEWPDRLGDDAPVSGLRLALVSEGATDEARRMIFEYSDPKWAEMMDRLKNG